MKISKKKQHKNFCINMEIKRKQMNYHWRRFTKLVELSQSFDKNSNEYQKITKMVWECFDRWSSLYLAGFTEDENENHK